MRSVLTEFPVRQGQDLSSYMRKDVLNFNNGFSRKIYTNTLQKGHPYNEIL